jgi:putative tricarboxylic transport membrane protein
MKTADFIGGGAGIALGSYVLYEGSKMPLDLIMKIGPSYFPDALAIGLIVFSVILIIYACMGRTKGKAEAFSLKDKGIQRALLSLLAIIAYAVLFIPLGYPLATLLLVGGIMVLLGKREATQIAIVSVSTTFAVWLIFAKLLMLSMPMGILEDLF